MSRPVYESEADLQNERDVANVLARKWNCEVLKLPRLWPADYCAVRGRHVQAFIEIKVRSYTAAQISAFGGYMIDVRKIVALKQLSGLTAKPAFLCIALRDGIYFVPATDILPHTVVMGGRTDRNDAADVEPCALIEMALFTKLESPRNVEIPAADSDGENSADA